MPQKGYKSLTIPEPAHRTLQEIKLELAKRGINSLPDETLEILKSNGCPICGSEMDGIEARFSYYRCPKCGFEKPMIDLKFLGSFALGAIATAAIIIGLRFLLRGD